MFVVCLWLCEHSYIVCACVCHVICVSGGGTDIEPTQHWYVSIKCLHTVSSLSLCLQSIELCLHSITVCTWLVPSRSPCAQQAPFLPLSKVHVHASLWTKVLSRWCLFWYYMYVLDVCMYVSMFKFYDCLPNAGEMFWIFFSCHTAAGLLVNSCEWDSYWL